MTTKKSRDSLTSLVDSFPADVMDGSRPLSFFDDNFVAPLASMEDLSVLMTPMSTPGPSPKTRARWSHRMSSGAQFDPLPPINDEVILELPQQSNGNYKEDFPYPIPPPRKDPSNILLRKSLANNRRNQPCPCMQSPHHPGDHPVRHILKSTIAEENGDDLDCKNVDNPGNRSGWNDVEPSEISFFDPWRPKDRCQPFESWRPRDGLGPEEKQRILDDSDYPFVRPRQVHFVQTSTPKSPKSRPDSNNSGRNSVRKGRSTTPETTSLLDSSATSGSRVSPEFGSLIRANDGRIDPESIMAPPNDRLNLIYLTMVLHGIGSLLAWNVFMTAKESHPDGKNFVLVEYFVNFKLSKEYTSTDVPYAAYFMQFIGVAAQIPNVVFNWINIFMNIGGTLTSRIVWTLLIEALVFVATIILAMVDSSEWPGLFFYLTFANVVILNMASGIYQNTVFGLAARLPFKYTGAVVLGTNLSGTIISLINILCIWLTPNPLTGIIYYFIVALFIILACFNSYFALPLSRFYQYHNHLYTHALHKKKTVKVVHAISHWSIFKQCFPQCFNIFFLYFVTLSVFPAVCADVHKSDKDFVIPNAYFTSISCFLTLNLCSVIGNILPGVCRQPGPRWLFVPVILRILFMPFFLLCNYHPSGLERLWPTLIYWDYAYWAGVALLGLSGGYLASLSMMHCPRSVEPEYASLAGMFGGASIVTGIIVGLVFGQLMPLLVTHPVFAFETPEWWPKPQ